MLVGLQRTDGCKYADIGFKTSDLGGLNYGFDMSDDVAAAKDEKPQSTLGSADRRNGDSCDNEEAGSSVCDAQTEEQNDVQSSDLADSGVTSLAATDNQHADNQEAEQGNGVENQDEMPETASQKVVAEGTSNVANPDDTADEEQKVDSSTADQGQEEPGQENEATADDDEEDPFQQLPTRAPYQDPPVFRGHTNYGFEFFPSWADIDETNRRQKDVQSESEKSSCEEDE